MLTNLKKIIPVLLTSLIFNSCATIYSGSHTTLHITSLPTKAKVEINGKYKGETPLAITIKKSVSKKQVILTKEGYKKKTFSLTKKFNPLVIIDFPTIVGGLVDVASGVVTPYKDRVYEMELKPIVAVKEKINKKDFYNTDDNFYVISRKGDTIYTEPFSTKFLVNKISFKPMGSTKNTLEDIEVSKVKTLETDPGFVFLKGSHKIVHYESHPYFPEQKPDNYTLMNVEMIDGDNKLLSMYFEYGLTNDGGDFRKFYGKADWVYYIYSGTNFIARLDRKDFIPQLKKYFPNCKDFVRTVESKKVKIDKLEKFMGNYKKANRLDYIKP